jgi:hypothetical protein
VVERPRERPTRPSPRANLLDADVRIATHGMQVAAEALELRRKEDRVGMIDLECCEASTRSSAAHGSVRSFNLVERGLSIGQPLP